MLRKVLVVVGVVCLVTGMAELAVAGCGACGAKKAATCGKKAACKQACKQMLAKLGLSKEQEAKIEAARAACKKAGCSAEAKAKCRTTIRSILTADQLKKLEAECKKAGAKCPLAGKSCGGKKKPCCGAKK